MMKKFLSRLIRLNQKSYKVRRPVDPHQLKFQLNPPDEGEGAVAMNANVPLCYLSGALVRNTIGCFSFIHCPCGSGVAMTALVLVCGASESLFPSSREIQVSNRMNGRPVGESRSIP